MNRLAASRIDLAIDRLQNGLRIGESRDSRRRAITLAEQLATIKLDPSLLNQFDSASEFKATQISPTVDTARRLRKITEIIEDDLGVDVGHSRFMRIATGLAKLSSLGSVVISGHNLISASVNLTERYGSVKDLRKIGQDQYTTFYQALGIFVIDCMLFTTPLNYKTAWLGTRFINNRFLYRLRKLSPNLHRYVLSEVHYVIREIPPTLLHGAVEYSEYLVSVTVSTFQQLWEFERENIGVVGIPDTIDRILSEFHEFAAATYAFETPNLDWEKLYVEILVQIKDFINVPLLSIDEMVPQIELSQPDPFE